MERIKKYFERQIILNSLKKNGYQIFKKEFDYAIKRVDEIIENNNFTISEKISLLENIIKMIKLDLQYETLVSAFYYKKYKNPFLYFYLPESYKDENGDIKEINSIIQGQYIDLEKDCVLVSPCIIKKMLNALKIKDKFSYSPTNHLSKYYDVLDICVVYNGIHSISNFILKKESGYIKSNLYETKILLNHIYTDGIYWYNKFDSSIIDLVIDFRIAIIFTIIQKINNLQ